MKKSNGYVFAVFLILNFITVSCCCFDGAYNLIPIEEERKLKANLEPNRVYSDSSSCLTVDISGGSLQAPFTKKVEAADLWLTLKISSDKQFMISFSNPHIISGENNIYVDRYSINFQESEKEKKKEIGGCRDDDNPIKDIRYTFQPGIAYINLHFSSYYDGLGFLQFPIDVNLGSVYCDKDTLNLDNVIFTATR